MMTLIHIIIWDLGYPIFLYSVICQFLVIGMCNQLTMEQKWCIFKQTHFSTDKGKDLPTEKSYGV